MIVTPSKFALLIEDIVKDKKVNYMDAVVLYCEENGIDPGSIKPLVNKHLKEKIAYEAQSLNMLKDKTAKLPIWKENKMLEFMITMYVVALVGGVIIQAAGV